MKHYVTGPKMFEKMKQKGNQYLDDKGANTIKFKSDDGIMLFGDETNRLALHCCKDFPVDDGNSMFDVTPLYEAFLNNLSKGYKLSQEMK